MRAIVIREFGGVDVLKHEDVDKPVPASNEVLIEVYAVGLNPIDTKLRKGELIDVFPVVFPRVLGGDVSGIIREVGPQVSSFKVGDEVISAVPLGKNGGYAEYVAVDEKHVALKPKSISFQEAASLPVAGLTSIQALRDFSKIKQGDNVLIHAGAGGVGSFAIQYASHMGANVYTTARTDNHEYVKSLGAKRPIDYKQEDFETLSTKRGGMDIILEAIGGENYQKSISAAKIGGAVPSIVNPPESDLLNAAKLKDVKTDFMLLSGKGEDLEEITRLVEGGIIKPTVSRVFTPYEIEEAHTLLESGRSRGKIVVKIKK